MRKKLLAVGLAAALSCATCAQAELTLYYNPDGGACYHADAYCEAVHENYLPLDPFGASQLDEAPYALLTPCTCVLEARVPTLYYNAEGGSYYHTMANCAVVDDEYLPLTAFPASQLGQAPYASLLPCERCTQETHVYVYHNADGGRRYHSSPTCYTVDADYLPLQELDVRDLPASGLEACDACIQRDQGMALPVAYFNPAGGAHYHEDPNCATVDAAYLPLSVLPGLLRGSEPFNRLTPCETCCK